MNRHLLWIIPTIIIIAWIILPTGTPEDLVTTIPLIAIFGLKGYIGLSVIVIVLLLIIPQTRMMLRNLLRRIGI